MLRMVTAYECADCEVIWTKAEATEAGPLVECKCGEQYEKGALGNCPECYATDAPTKVLSKLGCPSGCSVGVTPVRMLRITERYAYDGTWREPEEGGFLVRVTLDDLRRVAKEVERDA